MKKDISPFIVFSHQRSGTTKLCNEILSSHKDIFSFDELFNQPNHEPTDKALEKNDLESFYNLRSKIEGRVFGSVNRYTRYHKRFLTQLNLSKTKKHIGFKLFTNQVPPLVKQEFLLKEDNKIILLKRRNLAKAAVSIYLLLNHKQRNSKDMSELKAFEIDVDWCAHWIALNRLNINQARDLMLQNKKDFFYVEYEDLFELNKINEIISFIGASPLKELPSGGHKKMSSKDTYKKITNLKEFENKICNDYNGYLFE